MLHCYGIGMGNTFSHLFHIIGSMRPSFHLLSIAYNWAKYDPIPVSYHHPTFPCHSHVCVRHGPNFPIPGSPKQKGRTCVKMRRFLTAYRTWGLIATQELLKPHCCLTERRPWTDNFWVYSDGEDLLSILEDLLNKDLTIVP